MQKTPDHQRCDRRDLDHLMTQRLLIITKQLAAAAAVLRMVLLHIAYVLHRQQLRPCSGMTGLAATLAAIALLKGWRLKPNPVTEGRLLLRSLSARRSCGSSGQSAPAGLPARWPRR